MASIKTLISIKLTINVIQRCKYVLFTTVPLKALSEQVWIKYPCFCFFKRFFVFEFLIYQRHWRDYRVRKTTISLIIWSDKGFKGTVVNQAVQSLHGGLNEIKHYCFRSHVYSEIQGIKCANNQFESLIRKRFKN